MKMLLALSDIKILPLPFTSFDVFMAENVIFFFFCILAFHEDFMASLSNPLLLPMCKSSWERKDVC